MQRNLQVVKPTQNRFWLCIEKLNAGKLGKYYDTAGASEQNAAYATKRMLTNNTFRYGTHGDNFLSSYWWAQLCTLQSKNMGAKDVVTVVNNNVASFSHPYT